MILSKKALKWFKLSRDPFSGELHSGKDVILTHSVSIVELRIWRAIDEHQMAALVGDVGSGKSTIMEKILQEMRSNKRYRIITVCSLGRRKLSASQLCDAITDDLLGCQFHVGLEMKVRYIRDAFDDLKNRGQKILLTIDEAHELPTQTLKDFKKLHEVQGKFASPLSIVLVGQPRLHRRLQRDVSLKEVLDRIEIVEMPGLRSHKDPGMDEGIQYLRWKLSKAGGRQNEDVFTPDGLDMLLNHPAARYPLGINNLASLAISFAVEIEEQLVNADVMAHAFTQISYDGQVGEDDDGDGADDTVGRVA